MRRVLIIWKGNQEERLIMELEEDTKLDAQRPGRVAVIFANASTVFQCSTLYLGARRVGCHHDKPLPLGGLMCESAFS